MIFSKLLAILGYLLCIERILLFYANLHDTSQKLPSILSKLETLKVLYIYLKIFFENFEVDPANSLMVFRFKNFFTTSNIFSGFSEFFLEIDYGIMRSQNNAIFLRLNNLKLQTRIFQTRKAQK